MGAVSHRSWSRDYKQVFDRRWPVVVSVCCVAIGAGCGGAGAPSSLGVVSDAAVSETPGEPVANASAAGGSNIVNAASADGGDGFDGSTGAAGASRSTDGARGASSDSGRSGAMADSGSAEASSRTPSGLVDGGNRGTGTIPGDGGRVCASAVECGDASSPARGSGRDASAGGAAGAAGQGGEGGAARAAGQGGEGGAARAAGQGGEGGAAGAAGAAQRGSGGTGATGSPADSGQETNGGSLFGRPCAGYTLVGMPEMTGAKFTAKLIDMAGNIVHDWGIAGFPARMLPGGALIGCDGIVATYDCAEMRQVSWMGDVEWSFSNWVTIGTRTVARQHHDFEREGNPVGYYAPGQSFAAQGNTLVLAHERTTAPDIRSQPLLDDVIYEVTWAGERTGFEWHGAQHIDQFGFDAAALADIRSRAPNNQSLEWLHGNSLSRVGLNHWYDEGHAEFHPDNLVYSSRDASFIVILSPQTGDVVWRIGPDFAGRPEEALGQFAGQHNPHIIPKGLPGAGNMLVFDNGGASGYGGTSTTGAPNRYARSYSRVLEFDPITFEIVWQYGSEAGEDRFYSQLISNAQRLPNGNTLITIGGEGHVIEVTPAHAVVWEYRRSVSAADGNSPLYRAYRIPPEWLPDGENDRYGAYERWDALFER